MRKSVAVAPLLLMLFLFLAGTAWPQAGVGSVRGVVRDQTQAMIPGATVEVTNKAMGTKISLVTNDQGFYQATYLLPGLYRIEVQMPSFKKFLRDDVEVRINDRLEVNIKLEVGQLTEVITVTG